MENAVKINVSAVVLYIIPYMTLRQQPISVAQLKETSYSAAWLTKPTSKVQPIYLKSNTYRSFSLLSNLMGIINSRTILYLEAVDAAALIYAT